MKYHWSLPILSRKKRGDRSVAHDIKARGKDFAKFLESMPPTLRDQINAENRKIAQEEHAEFKAAFAQGKCSFCDESLESFDETKPCRHWLLKPDGFRKEHFPLLAERYSLGVLENYARWVANEEAFGRNINDLADEGTGKLVELTIKYKNITWSFSCGVNDLSGHESGQPQWQVPHYHFQMRVNDQSFIRYNDFHSPLSESDVGFLEYMKANPGKVKKRLAGGEGMDELLDESTLDHVVAMGRSGTNNEEAENAPVKLDSFIVADPGKEIKGEDLGNLIEEARREGVTLASKLHKLQGVRVQTIVSPGPGVVRQAPRSGRIRKGDPQLRAQDRAWREQQKRDENTP